MCSESREYTREAISLVPHIPSPSHSFRGGRSVNETKRQSLSAMLLCTKVVIMGPKNLIIERGSMHSCMHGSTMHAAESPSVWLDKQLYH